MRTLGPCRSSSGRRWRQPAARRADRASPTTRRRPGRRSQASLAESFDALSSIGAPALEALGGCGADHRGGVDHSVGLGGVDGPQRRRSEERDAAHDRSAGQHQPAAPRSRVRRFPVTHAHLASGGRGPPTSGAVTTVVSVPSSVSGVAVSLSLVSIRSLSDQPAMIFADVGIDPDHVNCTRSVDDVGVDAERAVVAQVRGSEARNREARVRVDVRRRGSTDVTVVDRDEADVVGVDRRDVDEDGVDDVPVCPSSSSVADLDRWCRRRACRPCSRSGRSLDAGPGLEDHGLGFAGGRTFVNTGWYPFRSTTRSVGELVYKHTSPSSPTAADTALARVMPSTRFRFDAVGRSVAAREHRHEAGALRVGRRHVELQRRSRRREPCRGRRR